MKDFELIFQCAAKRKGGEAQLQSLLPPIKSLEQVCSQTDDRILSIIRSVFFRQGSDGKSLIKSGLNLKQCLRNLILKYLNYCQRKTWKH